AAFARYDNISHILPAYAMVTPCEAITTTPFPGCNAHFSSFGGATDALARRSSGAHARQTGGPHAGHRTASARSRTAPAGSPQSAPGAAPSATAGAPAATTTTTTSAPPPAPSNPISSLLRFLLG
ncbi:MAG TPA: hypothetical protein VGX45_06690, partial [Solirubrobacteraceae bacterium]|nr:hypothetical protein [Solirubrobacteraceae bacterium]